MKRLEFNLTNKRAQEVFADLQKSFRPEDYSAMLTKRPGGKIHLTVILPEGGMVESYLCLKGKFYLKYKATKV